MARFGTEQLQRNAFRILGLKADATQAQIDAAARIMRLWRDPAQIPSTPNDAKWLGHLPRSSSDIEDAVFRLAHPESRIKERLWWFFITPPEDYIFAKLTPASGIEEIHAGAIRRLYPLLRAGILIGNLDHWETLLKMFSQLAESTEFLTLLQRAESHGEFEKRSEPHEVMAAQANMIAEVNAVVTDFSRDALYAANLAVVEKILQLFSRLEYCADSKAILLWGLEDHLVSCCNQARADINNAWKKMQVNPLAEATRLVASKAEKFHQPLMGLILANMPPDDNRRDRVRFPVIQLLEFCGKAFAGCYEYIAAEAILEKALSIACGTSMEATLKKQLDAIRPKAAGQPEYVRVDGRNTWNPLEQKHWVYRKRVTAQPQYRPTFGMRVAVTTAVIVLGTCFCFFLGSLIAPIVRVPESYDMPPSSTPITMPLDLPTVPSDPLPPSTEPGADAKDFR